jgi:putative Mg2+ transporter-C (MgtC) family protein
MDNDLAVQALRLLGAMLAGALIGLEREYRGREAGFRTHILVSSASSLLMLLVVFQFDWLPTGSTDEIRLDPTRMAQGIMTGIGFLGAGVVLKEGLNIRGLTTAASIWMTASIGIMFGIGMYFAALVALAITLVTLAFLTNVIRRIPTRQYAILSVRVNADGVPSEDDIVKMITDSGVSAAKTSYRLKDGVREYEMTVRTVRQSDYRDLAERLLADEQIVDYRIDSIAH